MIYRFKCPLCGQEHVILLQALFAGMKKGFSKFLYECAITHETYFITIQLSFEMEKSFDKEDIAAAEKDADFKDHMWKTEEENNADPNSRTT